MAKFGRFECGSDKRIETYEGDFMRSESAYVRIFKGGDYFGRNDFAELLATIRLSKGQSVREIKSSPVTLGLFLRSKGLCLSKKVKRFISTTFHQ
jgi:hypothetical protein